MSKGNRNRFLKGAAASVTALVVRVVLQLAQVPILYLGWDVKLASAWLVLWTLPSYMSLTVSSFSASGGNFALEAKREGDVNGVRAAYRATRIAIIASNLLMVLIVGIGFNFVIDDSQWGVTHSSVVWTILWLGLYVVIRVQSSTQDLAYRYGEDYGGFGFIDSAATVAELVAMAVVVSLTRNLAVLPAVLAGIRLVVFIYLHIRARARWPEVFGHADPIAVRAVLRRLLVPFLGFIAMPLLFSINIQGYSLLISNHYGPVLFATFLTMRTLARMVDQLCGVVNRVLFFELSYLDFNSDRERVIGLTTMTILALVGMCGLYLGTLLLVGKPLHAIWTAGKIAFSTPVLVAFGVAGMMRAVSDSLFNMLASRNAHMPMTILYLAGSLVSLVVALTLARSGADMAWVAGSVAIAEAVSVAAGLFVSARLFDTSVLGFLGKMAVDAPKAIALVPEMIRRRRA